MRNCIDFYDADDYIEMGILNQKCKQEDWYILGLVECGEMATDIELNEYECMKLNSKHDTSNNDLSRDYEEIDETIWVIVKKRFYDNECRETKLCRAFTSKEKADCYLRQIKHEFEDRYKCYGGKGHFTAYLRSNRNIKYRYYIDDVLFYCISATAKSCPLGSV